MKHGQMIGFLAAYGIPVGLVGLTRAGFGGIAIAIAIAIDPSVAPILAGVLAAGVQPRAQA